jgi:hypothetical protein
MKMDSDCLILLDLDNLPPRAIAELPSYAHRLRSTLQRLLTGEVALTAFANQRTVSRLSGLSGEQAAAEVASALALAQGALVTTKDRK